MNNHRINTTWQQIPPNQAELRTANLLKIIAKAEERMKRQGKSWSANSQVEGRGGDKQYVSVSVPVGNRP